MKRGQYRFPAPRFRDKRAGRGRLFRSEDLAAVTGIVLLTAVGSWSLVAGGTVVGMDAATQFYPWYSFLGESLRSFELPGWNPHQLSGTPFAADPLSGWTYLPAMTLFALLPLSAAAKTYLVFHLLLAGLAVYALARVLGISAAGALFAAASYEFNSFLYTQNPCCFAYTSVMAWLPLVLLGAELAIRSADRTRRIAWWALSGLALNQILAAWLGQGSYYALLALGGYVGYRALISPAGHSSGFLGRLLTAATHGGAILLCGFGLAAAGLLPRLEYNTLSNLAGGYLPEDGRLAETIGGWEVSDWASVLQPGLWYAGAATLALAIAGVVLSRRRFAVPYFAALSLGSLVLALGTHTPLHQALYLLPQFERLHPNNPERVMMLFYLGVALLAGAAVSRLGGAGARTRYLRVLAPAFLGVVALSALFAVSGPEVGWGPWALPVSALVLSGALVAGYARFPAWRPALCTLLVAVVFADLLVAGRASIASQRDLEGWQDVSGIAHKMDLEGYYRPSGAVRFLQAQEGEQFRYFGYGLRTPEARTISSPVRFAEGDTQALGVNNRAMIHGLYGIQGYQPVHLARYDEYFEAMNGRGQNYHHADVFGRALESPLLDLLGARYIVVPADPLPEDRERLLEMEEDFPVVYEDATAKVLENPGALPRAWIVHRAREAAPEDVLALLDSGAVSPRGTAILETAPPDLDPTADSSSDRISVKSHEPNRTELSAATEGAGLLVLGEVHYPAWRAYVDGEPAQLYRANHLFSAVSLPAGEHTVELRYESRTLRLGVAISLLTVLTLISAPTVSAIHTRRSTGKTREGDR